MMAANSFSYGDNKITTYWGGVFNRTDGSRGSHLVTPGPIVHGNHRDPNGWSYNVKTIRWDSGTATTTYPTWGYVKDVESGYIPGQLQPAYPSWDQSLRDYLYNAALEKVNAKVRGDLDLGVTLAEAGQTRKMLKSIAAMRNFAAASGFGTTKDLANGWLQWKYGWKPLMSDLFGVLNESLNICMATIRRVSGSAAMPLEAPGDHYPGVVAGGAYWTAKNSGAGKMTCRIVLEIEMPGATLDRWSSLNPVSLAWELTPYSFVIDWVYDVGSFLRAAETALLYDSRFKSGYVSELFVYDGRTEIKSPVISAPYSNPPYEIIASGFGSSVRRRQFVRTKLGGYPLPRQPSFKVALGSERLLTLASLLRQLLK